VGGLLLLRVGVDRIEAGLLLGSWLLVLIREGRGAKGVRGGVKRQYKGWRSTGGGGVREEEEYERRRRRIYGDVLGMPRDRPQSRRNKLLIMFLAILLRPPL
jgi:hypothetical protein